MLAPAPLSPCQATASRPASSVTPLLPSIPPSSSIRPLKAPSTQITASSCSLTSFRRRTRPKKNHLRTKQLSRNVSPELPAPSLPQPRDPLLLEELTGRISGEISAESLELAPLLDGKDDLLFTIEEDHEGKDGLESTLVGPSVTPRTELGDAMHPSPAATTDAIAVPKLLIELTMYLGTLLAVQTVCAVLFFWREDTDTKDEGATERSRSKKKRGLLSRWGNTEKKREIHSGTQVGINDSELANKVAEIRAMAKEVRVIEATKNVQGVEGTVGVTGGVKQEVSQRLKRLAKGTLQVVNNGNSSSKADIADKAEKPDFRRKNEMGRHRTALNRNTPKGFNGTGKKGPRGVTIDKEALDNVVVDVESHRTVKPTVDHDTATGESANSTVSQVSFLDGPSTDEGGTAESAHRNGSSLGEIHTKDSSKKLQYRQRYWWLKLQYVLGIYLQKASGGKNYKGLYTLKINSHLDGSSLPVTIVFEDRGDATNLCYLLESFFEDLSDVRADIVPITTQELVGAVEEKSLNALVIKKGQLQLYAGQLLSEVERQLQYLADENLLQAHE